MVMTYSLFITDQRDHSTVAIEQRVHDNIFTELQNMFH